jgi:Family of unknown function (DUF5317)
MSILFAALLAGAIVGLVLGGRPRNVQRVPLPRWFLRAVWIGLAAQLAIALIPQHGWGVDGRFALVLASYAAVAGGLSGLFKSYRHVQGTGTLQAAVGLVTVGWALNFLVIAANGGMPVSRAALNTVGGDIGQVTSDRFTKHVALSADTQFAFLGDSIPTIPGGPVLSAGDIVLALGLALAVAAALLARPTELQTSRKAA